MIIFSPLGLVQDFFQMVGQCGTRLPANRYREFMLCAPPRVRDGDQFRQCVVSPVDNAATT